jgi:hypothetical protein
MASIAVTKIFDGFMPPKTTGTYYWYVTGSGAWFFYATPRLSQSNFPQRIRIDRVSIETPQSTKFRAELKIANDSNAMPPDFPWADGCYFSVWVVSVMP